AEGLVFHFPHYNMVGINEPHSAIRIGDYKLLRFYSSERDLLFDVANDPGESTDLSEEKTFLKAQMCAALELYLEQVSAEKPEDSNSWEKGNFGSVKTRFFERYDN
ncbi:MAG: sulfatase/phosphatase domain-containing protein, partial [Verrucomicrobiota bacterium]|nr:sulfatase/phosphatase domain-containing protein [Verrucomicrobiota bacterium]